MKNKLNYIATVFALAVIFAGCEKDIEPVSKVVEVSYPDITLNGSKYVHIPVGGSFTDEGAVLTDDISGATSQITATESSVDPTTPGLYPVTYSAANANGFITEVTRVVLVLD